MALTERCLSVVQQGQASTSSCVAVRRKKAGATGKFAYFFSAGQPWIYSRFQPGFVQVKLNFLQDFSDASGRAQHMMEAVGNCVAYEPWPRFSTDATLWCDDRSKKKLFLKPPDLRVWNTKEALLMKGWKTSKRVKECVQMEKLEGDGGGSSSRSSVGATAGLSVQKRLPQQNVVKELHARMMGSRNQLFDANNLMDMYVKCGSMEDARCVFDNMAKRNVVSWNVMILGYAKKEEGVLALEMYARMQQEGVQPSDRTFVGALKACSGLAVLEGGIDVDGNYVKARCLERGRGIHKEVVEKGFETNGFVGSALINMYAKCGSILDARRVFDKLPNLTVVSWNAMILAYADKGEGEMSLQLYEDMQQQGVTPDDRTFLGALKACSSLLAQEERAKVDGRSMKTRCLEKCRTIHSRILKCGFKSNVFLGNMLIDIYAKCGSLVEARCIFDKLSHRNVVSWTAMISGYAEKQEGEVALQLFAQMQEEDVEPNHRTFVGVLKTCSSLSSLEGRKQVNGKSLKTRSLERGRAIHSQIVQSNFELDTFVGTTLVDMYAKCGAIMDARHVFDKLPHRNVCSWTAMILGYAEKQDSEVALQLYSEMLQEGVVPNDRTFVGALKACSSLASLEEGKLADRSFVRAHFLAKGRAIHSQVVNSGFASDTFVGSTLIDMYVKCGSMVEARHVFEKMPQRDVVCWNAMILGCAEQGESEEAFKLYAQLQDQGLAADSWTFVGILKACGNTAALAIGKRIHAEICQLGLETHEILATTLMDMYGKSGSMVDAQLLFDAMPSRDLVTWNALIAGYSRQGDSNQVFRLLERMKQEGKQPNGVTFLSVLQVCSHWGLLNTSKKYFDAMLEDYGITPTTEHYACVVGLLAHAGQVDDALAMTKKMPSKPDLAMWLIILAACLKFKNVEVGRQAFKRAVILDRKCPAAYMLMSSIYADAHMWEEHAKIQVSKKKALL